MTITKSTAKHAKSARSGSGRAVDSGRHHPRHPPLTRSDLRRARRRDAQVGRRRQRVHRLLDGPRRALPRPLPSDSRQGRAKQMARGTHLGACTSGKCAGRAGHAADPVRRAVRFTCRAPRRRISRCAWRGLHGALEDREVHGPLPRLARRRCRGRQPAVRGADVRRRPGLDPRPGRDLPAERHQAVQIALERGDVAAVILEPAGGQSGTTPTIPGYLQELRALTTRHGVVLIFDEVITGFRYSPVARRRTSASRPTSHARQDRRRGLPGAPSAASAADVPAGVRDDPTGTGASGWRTRGRQREPLCAAAAIATLELCADAALQARANKAGEELRRESPRR